MSIKGRRDIAVSNEKQSKSTMVELVEELQKLPQTTGIKHMVEEARAGEYHDFMSLSQRQGTSNGRITSKM